MSYLLGKSLCDIIGNNLEKPEAGDDSIINFISYFVNEYVFLDIFN